jgi:hypothetical protein
VAACAAQGFAVSGKTGFGAYLGGADSGQSDRKIRKLHGFCVEGLLMSGMTGVEKKKPECAAASGFS